MGEWALPADAQQHYHEVRHALEDRGELERARAVLARRHLAELPRQVSRSQLHAQEDGAGLGQARARRGASSRPGGDAQLGHARRELYRAQCNCCYWHGLFGGLYLNYLRDAVYRHLIEAELHAERVLGDGDERAVRRVRDLDADLQPEVRRCRTREARRSTSSPTSAAACSSSTTGPSASTCSTCSGGATRATTSALREAARKSGATATAAGVDPRPDRGEVEPGSRICSIYDRHPRARLRRSLPRRATTTLDDARRAAATTSVGDFAGGALRDRRPARQLGGASVLLRRARPRRRARGHRRQDAHARAAPTLTRAPTASAPTGGARSRSPSRPSSIADAARRRRARSLLPRRPAASSARRAQAGLARRDCRAARRSSWSTSGTSFFVRVSGDAGRDRCGASRSRPRRSPKAASSAPTRRR